MTVGFSDEVLASCRFVRGGEARVEARETMQSTANAANAIDN